MLSPIPDLLWREMGTQAGADGRVPKMGLSLRPLASARSQRSCLPRNSSPCLCACSAKRTPSWRWCFDRDIIVGHCCSGVALLKGPKSAYSPSMSAACKNQPRPVTHVQFSAGEAEERYLVQGNNEGIVGCPHAWNVILLLPRLLSGPLDFHLYSWWWSWHWYRKGS